MSDTMTAPPPQQQQQQVGEGYVEGRGKEDYNGGDHRADKDQVFLEMRDPEPQKEAESNRNSPPLSFVFGETSVFRDFLLSAFSDGYNSVACCTEEGFFPGGSDESCMTSKKSHGSNKTAQGEETVRRTGSYSPSVVKSLSFENKKKKKKPLAVAVGFNYANDAKGRPIVITPATGTRKHPIDLTGSGSQSFRKIPLDLSRSRSGRSGRSGGSSRTPPTPPHRIVVDARPPIPLAGGAPVKVASSPSTSLSQQYLSLPGFINNNNKQS